MSKKQAKDWDRLEILKAKIRESFSTGGELKTELKRLNDELLQTERGTPERMEILGKINMLRHLNPELQRLQRFDEGGGFKGWLNENNDSLKEEYLEYKANMKTDGWPNSEIQTFSQYAKEKYDSNFAGGGGLKPFPPYTELIKKAAKKRPKPTIEVEKMVDKIMSSDADAKKLIREKNEEGTDTKNYHKFYEVVVEKIMKQNPEFNRISVGIAVGNALDFVD